MSVTDTSPILPVRRKSTGTDTSGRGLLIVDSLARAVDIEVGDDHKSISAHLKRPVRAGES